MQFHNLFIHVISLQLVYGIGDFDYYDAFDSGSDAYRGKYIGDLSTFHHQVIKNLPYFFQAKYIFSNFSCMFLNPNIFFPI